MRNVTTAIESHPEGSLLHVKALAGSRQNKLRGIENGRLKVAVTQVAEKGKANEAIRELLAKTLVISKSSVVLISGELQPLKTFVLIGKTTSEVQNAVGDG